MPFPDANDYDVFTLTEQKTDAPGRDGGGFTLS
jgi:hypothetical protein